MKTFQDLKFMPHAHGDGLQATLFFPNGYGISVVRFKMEDLNMYGSYTSNESEWEVAVLFGDENDWSLTYNTPITDDVIGHQSESDVTSIMEKIQKLK